MRLGFHHERRKAFNQRFDNNHKVWRLKYTNSTWNSFKHLAMLECEEEEQLETVKNNNKIVAK